jgi:hypothetical protein
VRKTYEYNDKVYYGTQPEIFKQILEDEYGISPKTFGTILLGWGILYLITSVGLWQMRMWGWVLFVIGAGISIFLNLLSLLGDELAISGAILFSVTESESDASMIGSAMVGIVIQGLIAWWFVQNRWRFV